MVRSRPKPRPGQFERTIQHGPASVRTSSALTGALHMTPRRRASSSARRRASLPECKRSGGLRLRPRARKGDATSSRNARRLARLRRRPPDLECHRTHEEASDDQPAELWDEGPRGVGHSDQRDVALADGERNPPEDRSEPVHSDLGNRLGNSFLQIFVAMSGCTTACGCAPNLVHRRRAGGDGGSWYWKWDGFSERHPFGRGGLKHRLGGARAFQAALRSTSRRVPRAAATRSSMSSVGLWSGSSRRATAG